MSTVAVKKILSAESMRNLGAIGEIDSENLLYLESLARRVSEDEALLKLFVDLYQCIYKGGEVSLPEEIEAMKNDSYGFYALLALAGLPEAEKHFNKFGIPEDIRRGAYVDTGIWIKHFYVNTGRRGISPRILGWELGLFKGNLYRIGRLQFGIKPFYHQARALRNIKNRKVQAFASPGMKFNGEGLCDGVDGHFDGAGAWESEYIVSGNSVTGNPVSSDGFAARQKLTLNLSEWEEVLAPGDPVIDVHIPEGGPMTLEACADAMDRALKFFPEYFPDKPFKAFACESWIFDPHFALILKPESNIVKFQKEYYLFPIECSGEDTAWRIFGENGLVNGLANAPRNSSMQKACAEFMERGGFFRSGGGFYLLEEMPYGRAVYRS
ncbi:MAG: hypothetical protein A2020_08980 [Lentisphaerae bacterium GWF2_45_14]|nr:MAG: hypothetical protein A2020_08980 [Lentisphaerae bacterium GWF2_45_14]